MKLPAKYTVSIEIDTAALQGYTDSRLAALWHVAQANPAPFDDPAAGELAAKIGFEIIRRWLKATEPEMYNHQERSYYWNELRQLGKWNSDGEFVPGGVLVGGKVVPPEEKTDQQEPNRG